MMILPSIGTVAKIAIPKIVGLLTAGDLAVIGEMRTQRIKATGPTAPKQLAIEVHPREYGGLIVLTRAKVI